MQPRTILLLGSLLGLLAVAAGAFGAHALSGDDKDVFRTGAEYQMYHALALVLCGLLAGQGYRLSLAVWAFLLGVLLFSGSLYLLVLTGTRWLGAITPIGGVLFLVGWLALALVGWRQEPAASL